MIIIIIMSILLAFLKIIMVHVISLQDREPRGIIPLENLQVREVQDSRRKVFHLYLERKYVRRTVAWENSWHFSRLPLEPHKMMSE